LKSSDPRCGGDFDLVANPLLLFQLFQQM